MQHLPQDTTPPHEITPGDKKATERPGLSRGYVRYHPPGHGSILRGIPRYPTGRFGVPRVLAGSHGKITSRGTPWDAVGRPTVARGVHHGPWYTVGCDGDFQLGTREKHREKHKYVHTTVIDKLTRTW